MDELSYRRHRFPAVVIQHAVWLYFRFPLSYRDVEEMLAERGIDVTYETVRRWALKFGTIIARKLRRGRPRPDRRWHLDEVFISINGRQFYIWRAVDSEGEGNRQAAILRRRRAHGHARRRASLSQGAEQPRREFAPAHQVAGEADETVQVAGPWATFSVGLRHH